MTHESSQRLRVRAGDLNAALKSLLRALQRDIDVIHAQLQDAVGADAHGDTQRLSEQRDRLAMDLDVLRDQVPTLERLAGGGVQAGREAAALVYVGQLARAFLLAVDEINARARRILSPLMMERRPAWEIESARASVADTEYATIQLKRVLEAF